MALAAFVTPRHTSASDDTAKCEALLSESERERGQQF